MAGGVAAAGIAAAGCRCCSASAAAAAAAATAAASAAAGIEATEGGDSLPVATEAIGTSRWCGKLVWIVGMYSSRAGPRHQKGKK